WNVEIGPAIHWRKLRLRAPPLFRCFVRHFLNDGAEFFGVIAVYVGPAGPSKQNEKYRKPHLYFIMENGVQGVESNCQEFPASDKTMTSSLNYVYRTFESLA